MSYSVKCWTNTGYNAVNIPDSPSLLGDPTFTLPALNILQDWGLSSVRVRITSSVDIQNVDYVQIGNEYYSASSPTMVASDVAELSLVYDALTSAGGPGSLSYLDGITERYSVLDDTMFRYTQADEYMAPREALQITSPVLMYEGSDSTYTLVESTLDLYTLGLEFSYDSTTNELSFNGIGITFTDASGNEVTVPYTYGVGGSPLKEVSTTSFSLMNKTVPSPNTALFVIDGDNADANARMNRALGAIRALSMESAIISQTKYDKAYVDFSVPASGTVGDTSQISPLTGKEESTDSGLAFNRYTCNNNRLQYGEYNKYGIVTAAGEKGEFLPEQIGESTDTSPYVKMKADPRPDGKPYYRFAKYLGDSSDKGFWVNALGGLEWTNVPLTFQGASGSYLNRLNFENGAQSAKSAYTYEQTNNGLDIAQGVVNGVFDFMKAFGDTEDKTFAGWIGGMGQSLSNTGFSTARNILTTKQTADQYTLAREKELQNYAFTQSVVAPQVVFPFNANVVRDFIGNGCYVYRYYYSDNDVSRIDQLLTMYGYKDTRPLSAPLFSGRQYFNYVRANGVSIGGDLPLWKKSLIASQLNAGVRVWHVKPQTSYYRSGNPIVS